MSTHQRGAGGRTATLASKRDAAARAAEQADAQARAAARVTVADIVRAAAGGDRHPVENLYLERHARIPSAAQAALRQEIDRTDEKSLRTLDRERGLVFDPKTGEKVVDRMGTATHIYLSFKRTAAHPGARGELGEVKGRTYVHNHPVTAADYRADGSFIRGTASESDYRGSTYGWARNKPSEGVVVHGDTAIVFTPRADGTWPSWRTEVSPAMDRHWAALDQELARVARTTRNSAVRDALLQVSDVELLHLTWRAVSQDVGFGYQRVLTSSLGGGRARAKRSANGANGASGESRAPRAPRASRALKAPTALAEG